jgi:thiol-disulfide isomerase/thioredoxin
MTTPENSPETQQNSISQTTAGKGILKVILPIGAIVALAFGGLLLVKSRMTPVQPQPVATTSAGTELKDNRYPDFELQEFEGKKKKFSELQAKVVLVNFWATWCEACIVEMPSIVALRKAYAGRGLEIVAINVDEKPEAILPGVLKKMAIDFPVYTDSEGKLADIFDVHAIPLTVILNKDRKALFTHNGEYDWNSPEFRAAMDKWLTP